LLVFCRDEPGEPALCIRQHEEGEFCPQRHFTQVGLAAAITHDPRGNQRKVHECTVFRAELATAMHKVCLHEFAVDALFRAAFRENGYLGEQRGSA
jgi:hypothetical protein